MSQSDNNRRIAKNTLFLYIRMLVMMVISLFTSRVLLNKLGVENYGTYNIVGGIIVMFSFIQTPISYATQRFLNFEIGRKNETTTQQVFSVSLYLYSIFCIIAVLVGETIGLWFLNTQMNFPEGKMFVVNVIYQITIVTFCIGLIRTPYNASVIAYERMDFFAYWSIVMAILKLIIVYLIIISPFDALITYAFLFALVTLVELLTIVLFCAKSFRTTKFQLSKDKYFFGKMLSFSGWSLFGGVANTASQHGLNILVNIFFGVTVNAAIGIANQVSNHLYQLITNFQVAFNPQIVKLYAQDRKEEFLLLIEQTSKFSYYLFLIVSVPFIIFINPVLHLWLGFVPEMTGTFCRLILVFNLIMAASNPIWMSVQATGNIKTYQILMSSLIILNFPLSYLCLKLGGVAYYIWIVRILVEVIVYIVRLYYLKNVIGIDANRFVFKIASVMTFLLILNVLISKSLSLLYTGTVWSLLVLMSLSAFLTLATSFYIGISRQERIKIISLIKNRFNKNAK